jgi:hypothetical protein
MNEALFFRGLGPRGLCHKEMTRVEAYPVQVKLPCPLGLLSQWEEMADAELPCLLEMTEVAIVELLAQYEGLTVAELRVDLFFNLLFKCFLVPIMLLVAGRVFQKTMFPWHLRTNTADASCVFMVTESFLKLVVFPIGMKETLSLFCSNM